MASRTDNTTSLIVLPALLLILAWPATTLYQLALWLRDGFWTEMPLVKFWFLMGGRYPALKSATFERAAMWLLEQPSGLVFAAAGLIIIGLFLWLSWQ